MKNLPNNIARGFRYHVIAMCVPAVTLILLGVSCIAENCNYVIDKQDNVQFDSPRKSILETRGLQQCLKECSARAACLSVNFDKATLKCTINTESVTSVGGNTETAPDVVYLERNQWDQAIAGPCEHTVCPSHSKCIALSSGLTTCVVIECIDPIEYSHAYITTTEISQNFGSTLQYDCQTGYVWMGGAVTCTSSGAWQGDQEDEGCLALAGDETTCDADAVCSLVTSAKCRSDLCVCPLGYAYLVETSICTKDCKSLFNAGHSTNGVYEIAPDGIDSVSTFCDMENGGWTLFERRSIGDVDFMLNWDAYRLFFGAADGDFWIGLDFLHALTVADNDVYFDFQTTANQPFFAEYHNFSIADNSNKFKLTMSSNFSITSEYAAIRNGGLYDHNNMYFSTPDSDNDISTSDCASTRGSWWWNKCFTFGMFTQSFNNMRLYMGSNNEYVYFKETTMKVRRTK